MATQRQKALAKKMLEKSSATMKDALIESGYSEKQHAIPQQ